MGESDDAQLTSIKTQLAARSKDMVKLRDSLININDELEDEGDRVFFGSTNDADDFRAAVKLLDDWAWHDILEHAKGEDLYAEIKLAHDTVTVRNEQIRELNAELTTLRARLSRLSALLDEAEGALDLWINYADEVLSEFDLEDCATEPFGELCPRCRPAGCIKMKIDEARSVAAAIAQEKSK